MISPSCSTIKAAVAIVFVTVAASAFGAAPRTFVASTGSDANPCNLAFPCRSFVVAVAATTAGGEVVALDSAGYGAVAINKAITIAGPPGVQASITASSNFGVEITAAASDRVVLRGLDIITTGTATYGIKVVSASDVVIEDCLVSGTATYVVGSAAVGRLTISRSRIQAAADNTAIAVSGFGGGVRFVVDETRVEVGGSGIAVLATDTVNGTVRDSTLLAGPGGSTYGVYLQGSSGKVPTVTVQRTLVTGHGYGIFSDGQGVAFGANVSVVNSNVTENQFGVWATKGGTIGLADTHVGHNDIGATADLSGIVFTDGRNWFGYNQLDLNLSTTLIGPIGLR